MVDPHRANRQFERLFGYHLPIRNEEGGDEKGELIATIYYDPNGSRETVYTDGRPSVREL